MYRVSFVGALTIASAAAAEPLSLDAKTLADLVPGATVQLDTPLGTKLPVKYGANGLMSGDAPALAFFLGSATDRGRWWVANDKLCHKWFKWFDAEVQCLHLKRDGAKIFWTRDDGKTGTATLLPPEPIVAAPYALGNPEPAREEAQPTSPALAAAAPATAPATASAPATHGDAAAAKTTGAASTTDKPPTKAAATARPTVAAMTGQASATPAPQTKTASLTPVAPTAPPTPPVRAATATATLATIPAKPAEPASFNVLFKVAGVRADDVLNVRQGPSADTPAVGNIPPTGHGVRLLGRCLLEWCPIVHGSVSGWVNSTYLIEDRKPVR